MTATSLERGSRVHLLPGARLCPGGWVPAHGARAIVAGTFGHSSIVVVIVERLGWQLVERRNVRPLETPAPPDVIAANRASLRPLGLDLLGTGEVVRLDDPRLTRRAQLDPTR